MKLSKLLFPLVVLTGILISSLLCAQTQFVSADFFPADLEFKEIRAVQADRVWKDAAELSRLEYGPVLLEAGLSRYAERTYVLVDSSSMVVSIYTLGDARNAYSVLTMLARSRVQAGPPGDFFASEPSTLLVTTGKSFVRIRSAAAGDLARRVAISIANRIGNPAPKAPSLIRHIPQESCDPSSIRYFLGSRAMKSFGTPIAGAPLTIPADVEVAQAHCAIQDQAGTFTLLSFPTIPMAEEYFNSSPLYDRSAGPNANLYTRHTGPLVAILEGNFAPITADKTLGSLKFSYSIKWIYEKNKPSRIIWGVPVKILGTVVRSLLFTALLCVLSLVAGVMLAGAKLYARRRWKRIAEHDYYIRLKLDEN
jgi:hypothetical protein